MLFKLDHRSYPIYYVVPNKDFYLNWWSFGDLYLTTKYYSQGSFFIYGLILEDVVITFNIEGRTSIPIDSYKVLIKNKIAFVNKKVIKEFI